MSKWFVIVLFWLISCGDMHISSDCALNGNDCKRKADVKTEVRNGSSCSVVDMDDSVKIYCTDGTESIFDKPKDGKDGVGEVGPKGDAGEVGPKGDVGDMGPAGKQGMDGADGYSTVFFITDSHNCSSGGKMILLAQDANRNGVLDLESDTGLQSADICNGDDGSQGPSGQNGAPGQFTAVTVIDPCGDKNGTTDEILLKVGESSIITTESDKNGKNPRFSLLPPGNYVTNDGSMCFFTVDSGMNIVNQHY